MSQTLNKYHDIQTDRGEVINDIVSGCLCLALALGLAGVHFSQAGRLHDDFARDPGPALLPLILLAALGLAGGGLTLRGWFGLKKTTASSNQSSLMSLWPAALAVALMCAFLPLRHILGAALALCLIGAALAVLAGRSDNVPWFFTAVFGGVIGLILYALFHFGLSVPL
ncbi:MULTISPECIES: tripartite tricarboxylate transporter TctB family protein [Pacificibacter]|uniref:tripartite tricarboxylate transporter TctB family protein n=1 Tax=Pacificibacter TaxID=1042323 RepID=UPI001C0A565F|nr:MULTISPECIES: tripartite tricarboxylate transporter TctB family protein [Pacificibacter]MBU2935067.1 tripartite tricarboxylate transporter TctB family protein [Pacificibacter marinus]MDO6617376.1 tripartite tricarboxylate transporter TctB family protein [Pacificibacter sp. 1_MG-2023]